MPFYFAALVLIILLLLFPRLFSAVSNWMSTVLSHVTN